MMVELFDRKDGTGADWQLMAESVFRAGFDLVDDKLEESTRQTFYRRIHEGSYRRISAEGPTTEAAKPLTEPLKLDFAESSQSVRPNRLA